jgi:hypothetical protein
MRKLPLGLLALTVLAVGGYASWWKPSSAIAPGTSKSPVVDLTPARPVTAVVGTHVWPLPGSPQRVTPRRTRDWVQTGREHWLWWIGSLCRSGYWLPARFCV